MSSLQEIIDKYSGKYHHKVKRICEPLIKTFGVDHFFYQSVASDGTYYFVGSSPDFLNFYYNQKLHECNPLITQPDQLVSGVYLNGSIKQKSFQNSLELCRRKRNLEFPLILVERNQRRCDEFGFGVDCHRTDVQSLVLNEIALFRRFNRYFVSEMGKLLEDLAQDPCVIPVRPPLQKGLVIPEITLNESQRLAFLSNVKTTEWLMSLPKLSKREKDCLKYYLQGMSSRQIGAELELSYRTVEYYIEHVKNKLGCNRKSELISILNELKSVGLYPDL